MTNKMRALALIVSFSILLPCQSSVHAQRWLRQESEEPAAEAFIQTLADQAVVILDNDAVPLDQRRQEFSGLVRNNTDVAAIAKFTIGRYRRTATIDELEEFLGLFNQFTVNFYESRLSFYSGQRLEVTGSIKRGEDDVVVTSILRMGSAQRPAPINWRLYGKDTTYVIRDMEVFGVWLGIEQRSQFTAIIANNGGQFSALLDMLRDRVAVGEGLSTGGGS